jgi:hypothetical protein
MWADRQACGGRAAFEVSYAQLVEEDARLFRRLGLHPGPDFTADSAAALAGAEAAAAGAGPAGRSALSHRRRRRPVN